MRRNDVASTLLRRLLRHTDDVVLRHKYDFESMSMRRNDAHRRLYDGVFTSCARWVNRHYVWSSGKIQPLK